jgi:hypothetical protein
MGNGFKEKMLPIFAPRPNCGRARGFTGNDEHFVPHFLGQFEDDKNIQLAFATCLFKRPGYIQRILSPGKAYLIYLVFLPFPLSAMGKCS